MSIAIQRDGMIHLDGYSWNKRREDNDPLLKTLAEDLLANGFKDVGPTITKLVVDDKSLQKTIDNFIVYYYDSSTSSPNAGAYGIIDPQQTPPDPFPMVSYSLDDSPYMTKEIEDSTYADKQTWHNYLAKDFMTSVNASTAGLTDQLKDFLGPNAELFSYLNPHPDNRDADGNWYKESPPAAKIEKVAVSQKGYIGLSAIAKLVYENEFKKIKRLITTGARGVQFYPAEDTGLDTQANLTAYKEVRLPNGKIEHHFWVATYPDENFFPENIVEPTYWEGLFSVSPSNTNTTNKLQRGDTYDITFTSTYADPAQNIPSKSSSASLEVKSENIADFMRDIEKEFIKTITNQVSGIAVMYKNENSTNTFNMESADLAFDLSMTYTWTPYSAQNYTQPVTYNPNNGNMTLIKSELPINYSPVTEEEVLYGLSGQTDFYGTTGDVSPQFYEDGYVHGIEIDGFEGANPGDEITIELTGLIDESASEPWNAPTVDVSVSYTAIDELSDNKLMLELVGKMKQDPYISRYMNVISNSKNSIRVEYNKNSSGYMKRSVMKNGSNWGLFNLDSTIFSGVSSANITEWNENSSLLYGVSDPYSTSPVSIKHVGPFLTGKEDAFFVADLPSLAQFNASINYVAHTQSLTDPLDITLETSKAADPTSVTDVRISFPLARDLGTFGNPVYQPNIGCYIQSSNGGDRSNYPLSYSQRVLFDASVPTAIDRSSGPEVSFDPLTKSLHPNSTHGNIAMGMTHFSEFEKATMKVDIQSFEVIRDHSIGPLVFETQETNSLSGVNGDQPWRIRFGVSRGYEIKETSPYISEIHSEFEPVDDEESLESDAKAFEYLTVHLATKYQLKSNGDVTQTQGADGIKAAVLREPGYLGSLRPQYQGFSSSIMSQLNPYIDRVTADNHIEYSINTLAGVVGYQNDGVTKNASSKIGDTFTNGVPDVSYVDGTGTTQTITKGLLESGEYRFEEKYLTGTTSELIFNTPFTTGSSRLQKGFFRRTGKSFDDTSGSYPMGYDLTIMDHGVYFQLQDHASEDQSDDCAWFVVQKHVDSTTGLWDTTSESQPLHCLYMSSEPPILYSDLTPYFNDYNRDKRSSLAYRGVWDTDGTYYNAFKMDEVFKTEFEQIDLEMQSRFRRFIVREKDTLKPWDRHVFAGINETDSFAVINPLEQISLNESGQLVIQFPNRLTSQRYMYTGKELDMVAFCDGGAVGADTIITSDRFSTAGTTDRRRYYKGGVTSKAFGNGMRILAIVGGWGISNTYIDTTTV